MILVQFLYEDNCSTAMADDRTSLYGLRSFQDEGEFDAYLKTYVILSREKFETTHRVHNNGHLEDWAINQLARGFVYYYSSYDSNYHYDFESFDEFKSHFTILTNDTQIIDIMLGGNSFFHNMKGEFPRLEISGQ